MTAPTPNAELAWRVLDQIDAHPELHRQDWWFTVTDCGTAGCFAGWACVLSGDKPKAFYELAVGLDISYVVQVDGRIHHVSPRARELLGIDDLQGGNLFASHNTREDLGCLVEEIFGPRPAAAPTPVALDYDDVPPNAGSAS